MVTGRFPSMDSFIKIMKVLSQCITFAKINSIKVIFLPFSHSINILVAAMLFASDISVMLFSESMSTITYQ